MKFDTLAALLLYRDSKALQGKGLLDIMSSGKEEITTALHNRTSSPMDLYGFVCIYMDLYGFTCF
jgi:hypothetical protein